MSYFFDDFDAEQVDEMEMEFIDCVKILMSLHQGHGPIIIKYKNWKIPVWSTSFEMQGHLSSRIKIAKVTIRKEDGSLSEKLYLEKLSCFYRMSNMLLTLVCDAYDLDSLEKFNKFIAKLKTAAVSNV